MNVGKIGQKLSSDSLLYSVSDAILPPTRPTACLATWLAAPLAGRRSTPRSSKENKRKESLLLLQLLLFYPVLTLHGHRVAETQNERALPSQLVQLHLMLCWRELHKGSEYSAVEL